MTTRPRTGPRRGLNRTEAADYIGISVSKFDQLVAGGLMPPPKSIDRRNVWDLWALDAAFEALPDQAAPNSGVNEWDRKLGLDQSAA